MQRRALLWLFIELLFTFNQICLAKEEEVDPEETLNQRIIALEGSPSLWSGQLKFTYRGSTLRHPLAEEAPNPGRQVPAPLVTLQGTLALRYRIDDDTSLGFGTGLSTETPLQGARHTTLANPYVDITRQLSRGSWHSLLNASVTHYTENQYAKELGYRQNLGFTVDSYYEKPLVYSLGLSISLEGNTFARGDYPKEEQVDYHLLWGPFFEYSITKRIGFRTVIGSSLIHTRNASRSDGFFQPEVYQTLGLSLGLGERSYVYAFVRILPLQYPNITMDNSMFGCSLIINLF